MALNPASSSGNAVQITIRARNEASEVFQRIETTLQSVGNSAIVVQTKMLALANAIVSLGSASVSGFSKLLDIISVIRSQLDAPIGQALITSLRTAAAQALEGTQPLTAVGSTISRVTGDVISSFTGLSGTGVRAFSGIDATIVRAGQRISELSPAINTIDSLLTNVVGRISAAPGKITTGLNGIGDTLSLVSGVKEPLELFQAINKGAGLVFNTVARVGQQISFLSSGLQALQQIVSTGPFRLLIQQNLELEQKLLGIQATLVGTNKIIDNFKFGGEIKDPGAAIQALRGNVEGAVTDIRKGSLELVGVTSSQLIDAFSIVAGQAGQVGINLSQAAQLTLSFAAALGTLGVPLYQARQEITSILQGTIDQNSVVAKSLNITNDQVRLYKQQGTLFDQLTKRLEAFRAGNKLAADTIGGYGSNIVEIIENVGLAAGKPLIAPITREFGVLYNYLKANQGVISDAVSKIAVNLFEGIKVAFDGLKQLAGAIQPLFKAVPEYLLGSLSSALEIFGQSLISIVAVLRPVINGLIALFEAARPLAGILFQVFIYTKTLALAINLLSGAFGIIVGLLPGVGDFLYILTLRNGGLINSFTSLTGVLGTGAAGFLTLGQNIEKIPGATAALSKALESALGPIGPVIAGFVPKIAGVGITVFGLAKAFPPLEAAIKKVFDANPVSLVRGLSGISSRIVGAVPLLGAFSGEISRGFSALEVAVGRTATNTTLAAVVTTRWEQVLGLLVVQARKTAIALGIFVVGGLLVFQLFDQLILKNQALIDTFQGIAEGLGIIGEIIVSGFSSPVSIAITTLILLFAALKLNVLGLIGTQLTTWALSAVGALVSLSRALIGMRLVGLATGVGQVATGLQALALLFTQGSLAAKAFLVSQGITVATLPAVSAGMAGAATATGTFATAVWTLVAGLYAAVAPFLIWIAIIVATGLAVYKLVEAYSDGATEAFRVETEALSDATLGLARRITNVKKAQEDRVKNGIKLTEKEYQLNQLLIQQAREQIRANNEQIAKLRISLDVKKEIQRLEAKKRNAPDEAAKKEIDTEIAKVREITQVRGKANELQTKQLIEQAQFVNKTLRNSVSDTQTLPKDLARLGTVYEQLAGKVRTAEESINRSAGDPAIFKQKAQELIELTQSQLKFGQITAEEARRRITLITNNVSAEQDIQIKAQEAITETYKLESQKRLDIIQARLDETEAKVSVGQLTEVEGIRETTKLKKEQLEEQLRDSNRIKENEAKIEAISLEKTLQGIDEKRKAAGEELAAAKGDPNAFAKVVATERKKLEEESEALKDERSAAYGEGDETKVANAEAGLRELERRRKELESRRPGVDSKQIESSTKTLAQLDKDEDEAVQASGRRNAQLNQEKENAAKSTSAKIAKSDADSQKQVNDAQVRAIDRANQYALDTAKSAENERTQQVLQLKQQGLAGELDVRESQAQLAKEAAEKEIEVEKAKLAQLEALPKLAKIEDEEDRQAKIRASRLKTQQLTISILNSEYQAYDAHIARIRNLLTREQLKQQIASEALARSGAITQADVQVKAAQQKIAGLEKDLRLETRDKDKRLKLQLDLEKAKTELQNSERKKREAILDRSQNQELAKESKLYNERRQFSNDLNDLDVIKATQGLARLQRTLKQEKLDGDERAKIEKDVQDAILAVQNAQRKRRDTLLERSQNQEYTQELKLYNDLKVRKTDLELFKAEQALKRLERTLKQEKLDADERAKIERDTQEAISALQEAQYNQQKERLEDLQLQFKNRIDTENLGLQRQTSIYESLTKALEFRNSLLKAGQEITKLSNDLAVTELDVIAQGEKSEYVKKQLAEITAAFKLKALKEQQKFELESLRIQEQQRDIALEREEIEARIQKSGKIAEIADTVSQIELAKLPGARTTPAQRQALAIKLQAQLDQAKALDQKLTLIGQEKALRPALKEAEAKKLGFTQRTQEVQAVGQFVQSITSPGQKAQLQRALTQQIVERYGAGNKYDFIDRGLTLSGQTKRELFPSVPGAGNALSGYEPDLGFFQGLLPNSGYQQLLRQTQSNFNKDFGRNVPYTRNIPEGTKPLALPSVDLNGLGIQLKPNGDLLTKGIDRLVGVMEKGGASQTININVAGQSGTVNGQNQDSISLEKVLKLAKDLVRR